MLGFGAGALGAGTTVSPVSAFASTATWLPTEFTFSAFIFRREVVIIDFATVVIGGGTQALPIAILELTKFTLRRPNSGLAGN